MKPVRFSLRRGRIYCCLRHLIRKTAAPTVCRCCALCRFLTEILLKIYHAIGQNWERVGNVHFAVIYKPEGDTDRTLARERSEQIAREWASAMESAKGGYVRDFVAAGNVDIKVIGADNQVLDSEVPVRMILEQLIAQTGIPPFLLGLNWSSTERMSSQQADMLTTEMDAIRRTLTPVVEKVCRMWLRTQGYACDFEVVGHHQFAGRGGRRQSPALSGAGAPTAACQ